MMPCILQLDSVNCDNCEVVAAHGKIISAYSALCLFLHCGGMNRSCTFGTACYISNACMYMNVS